MCILKFISMILVSMIIGIGKQLKNNNKDDALAIKLFNKKSA